VYLPLRENALQSSGDTILIAYSAFVEVAASIKDGDLAPEGDCLLREREVACCIIIYFVD
jgi:hypothetical protein